MIKRTRPIWALVLLSLLSICGLSQKSETKISDPGSISSYASKYRVIGDYIRISRLSENARAAAFGNLSAAEKADFFRFNLVFQALTRPSLNQTQKSAVLEMVSSVVPENYLKNIDGQRVKETKALEQKAMSMFSREDAISIFAHIGTSPESASRLTKYYEIAQLDSSDNRVKAFALADPIEKSNCWNTKLFLYLAQNLNLSSNQKATILEGLAMNSPEFYSMSRKSPEWSSVDSNAKAFVGRSLAYFSHEQMGDIFFRLYAKDETKKNWERVKTAEGLGQRMSEELKFCKCSVGSWFDCWSCSDTQACMNPIIVGDPDTGCGFQGGYRCDGRCAGTEEDQ